MASVPPLAGYAMADHMRTDLIIAALDVAVRNGRARPGVTVFHSDRGTQYTSDDFAKYTKSHGITRSVGRTGTCYDNAWAESFNATLKNERVHRTLADLVASHQRQVPRDGVNHPGKPGDSQL